MEICDDVEELKQYMVVKTISEGYYGKTLIIRSYSSLVNFFSNICLS